MKNKVLILGPSFSGKDYLKDYLITKGFKYFVPYTTRPKRNNEIHNVDYKFISIEDRNKLTETKTIFIESLYYDNWYYTVFKEDIKGYDLFIINPVWYAQLLKYHPNFVKESVIIYLNISIKDRLDRINKGRENEPLNSRIKTDEEYFKFIKNDNLYTFMIEDKNFKTEEIYKQIKKIIK